MPLPSDPPVEAALGQARLAAHHETALMGVLNSAA
jgi:hypothetical protein